MAVDEQQDWVDRAMPQGVWEPPDGFTDRVVLQTMAALPRRVSFKERLVASLTGVRESVRSRIEVSAWVFGQYRDLLLHS
jgi:hypothetical protein